MVRPQPFPIQPLKVLEGKCSFNSQPLFGISSAVVGVTADFACFSHQTQNQIYAAEVGVCQPG